MGTIYIQRLSTLRNRLNFEAHKKEPVDIAKTENLSFKEKDLTLAKNKTLLPDRPKLSETRSLCFAGHKWKTCNVSRPFWRFNINVPTNKQIVVTTSNSSVPSVDPFCVIYEIKNGSRYEYTLQQELAVLDYNDDYSGLLPKCTWINNSSSSKPVCVLVFAYDEYGQGNVELSITVGGLMYYSNSSVYIGGIAMFSDNTDLLAGSGQTFTKPASWQQTPVGNAILGTSTAIIEPYLEFVSWGDKAPSTDRDTYIWIFNFSQGKGMANDDIGSDDYSSVVINWVVPTWMSMPMGYHYPNVMLVGGYSNGGTAKFLEVSLYKQSINID